MFLCVVYQVRSKAREDVELQSARLTLGGRPRKFKYIIIINILLRDEISDFIWVGRPAPSRELY